MSVGDGEGDGSWVVLYEGKRKYMGERKNMLEDTGWEDGENGTLGNVWFHIHTL